MKNKVLFLIQCFILSNLSWVNLGWGGDVSPPPHFTLYYKMPDPAAAPPISQQFLGLQPIQKEYLFLEFSARLEIFHNAMKDEARASQSRLDQEMTRMQSYSPSLEKVESTLQHIQDNLDAWSTSAQRLPTPTSPKLRMPSGYEIQAPSGEFQRQLTSLYYRLNYLAPATGEQANVRQFALLTLESADRTYATGQEMEAQSLYHSAQELSDAALAMLPGSQGNLDVLQSHFLTDQEYQKLLGGFVISTSPLSVEGREIRSHFNGMILAQFASQGLCGTENLSPGIQGGCSTFNAHFEKVKAGLLLSDRLASGGHMDAYHRTMEILRPYVGGLKGFAGGVLRGSITLGTGFTAAAFLPEAVAITAATTALGYVAFEAIKIMSEYCKGIRGLLQEKWQEFIQADPEHKGKILGDLTVGIGGILYGGPLSLGMKQALQTGVELAVSRVAAKEMISAAEATISLPGGFSHALNFLSDEAPIVASDLLTEMQSAGKTGVALAEAEGAAQKLIDSAWKIGIVKERLGSFFRSSIGGVWANIQATGKVLTDYGYKLFKKDAIITNPLPSDGWFARVMPRKFAEQVLRGECNFAKIEVDPITGRITKNEAFITAYEDIAYIRSREGMSQRLALFKDEAGTIPVDLAENDSVILKFRFKDGFIEGIRSPIETVNPSRQYGFVPEGRSGGDAREWLIDADSTARGIIDIRSISIEEIMK